MGAITGAAENVQSDGDSQSQLSFSRLVHGVGTVLSYRAGRAQATAMMCAVLQGLASRYMRAVPGAAIRLSTLRAGLERWSDSRVCKRRRGAVEGAGLRRMRWRCGGNDGEDGDGESGRWGS